MTKIKEFIMTTYEWFLMLLLIMIAASVALIALDVHQTIGIMQLQEML
jgi:hypothetical protein